MSIEMPDALLRLPSTWPVLPLLAATRESKVSNTDMRESNLLSLSYGNIIRKDINTSDGLLPASFETYQVVDPGMVVFRFTDLQNDQRSLRSGLVMERGIITSAYVAVQPDGFVPGYFAYLMRAYDTTKVFYGMGGGVRQSIKYADIRRLPVPVPPLDEQRAITEYLDRETAQIDALIAKQEKFLELLRERRLSLLDEHFQAAGGRRQATVRQVLVKLKRPVRSGLGVITAYRDGQVTLRSNRREDGYTFSDTESGYQEVLPGDIVFHALDGFAGAVGVSDSHGICTPVYHVCKPRYDDDPEYLALLLRYLGTSGFLAVQAPNVRQRSVDFRSWTTFARVPLSIPSVADQRAYVAHYRDRRRHTDMLIAKTERHIDLARERRAALITEVVTGRIKPKEHS